MAESNETNTTIELKNPNTISFSLFEREKLLGDWVKFRVSDKGWWGYAYIEKEPWRQEWLGLF